MADSKKEIREKQVPRSVVSKWVEQLSSHGIIALRDGGSMGIAMGGRLNRSVRTGPIEELTVYRGKTSSLPLFSIEKIEGKYKFVISIDSNLIPEKIESLQERSRVWITRFRYAMWLLIVLSSFSFILEVIYDLEITDITAIPRLMIFIFSLILYGIVGRIHLRGVAKAIPVSIYGCSNCGDVIAKEHSMGSKGFPTCEDCGSDMVPLMEGTPSSLRTQSEEFEALIHEELTKLKEGNS